ncbi:MAG: sensor histidine kinase [Thiogranum sp.]
MTRKPRYEQSQQRPVERGGGAEDEAPPYDVLRAFFSISHDMFCVADVNGYFLVVNPAFERVLGYTRQELLETSYIEFVHPEDKALTLETAIRNTQEPVTCFENRYRCKDGSYRWLAWTAVSGLQEGQIYAVARDISEAKVRQLEEEKQRRLLETVLANVPASIFWKDRNSVFLGANKRFLQDAGLQSPDELIGKTDYDLAWTRQEAEFYRQCDHRVMGSGQPLLNIEEPQRQAAGKEVYLLTNKVPLLDESGTVYGMLGIYMDITERKHTEQALRESEERYRAVVETAADGFWIVDTEGRIQATNNAYARRSGYSREQLLSMSVADVEADEDTAAVRRHMDHVRHFGGESFETHHRTKSGTVWPVEVHASYWDSGGGYYFAFLHDISNRMALERAIIKASTAEQERIGRDIHDGLGQQLTGISMLAKAEELRLRQTGEEQAANAVAVLVRHTEVALKQARAMARGLRPVEIAPDGLAYALANLAKQVTTIDGVDCQYLGLADLAVEDEVAAHLFRIAQEAVQNALKHAQATRIELDLRRKPEGLLLTVRDDGRGIDPDVEQGDSMGLKIMRYRANILGGRLTIGPEPHRGTLVRCVVPLRPHLPPDRSGVTASSFG